MGGTEKLPVKRDTIAKPRSPLTRTERINAVRAYIDSIVETKGFTPDSIISHAKAYLRGLLFEYALHCDDAEDVPEIEEVQHEENIKLGDDKAEIEVVDDDEEEDAVEIEGEGKDPTVQNGLLYIRA